MKLTLNRLIFIFGIILLGNIMPNIAKADTIFIGYNIVNVSIGPMSGTNGDPFTTGKTISAYGSIECYPVACVSVIMGAKGYGPVGGGGGSLISKLNVPATSLLAKGGGGVGSLPSGYSQFFDTGSSGSYYSSGSASFAVPPTPGTYYMEFAMNGGWYYTISYVAQNAAPTCGTDTYTCPDGTVVGRASGSCDFDACPPSNPSVTVWADSASIPYNGTDNVHWTSTNATSCSCTYGPSNNIPCGTGIGNTVNAANNPYTLAQTTTFNVSCTHSGSCTGTVVGSTGPYEGQSCSQFTSQSSCYQGMVTHGCHWIN